jgi:hypothetical protein
MLTELDSADALLTTSRPASTTLITHQLAPTLAHNPCNSLHRSLIGAAPGPRASASKPVCRIRRTGRIDCRSGGPP